MANKRNNPKPGSTFDDVFGTRLGRATGTFNDMVFNLQKEKSGSEAARGEQKPHMAGWGRKAKHGTTYAYTGNEGKSCQLPMKMRKANLLKYMQTRLSKIMVKDIEPAVLKQLIDDGEVYIENGKSGHIRQSHAYAVPTERPEMEIPRVVEPHKKKREAAEAAEQHFRGKNQGSLRVDTQTIKWNKEKDDKLLLDALRGEADPELVKEIGRIKTKYRKITINSSKKRDSNEE